MLLYILGSPNPVPTDPFCAELVVTALPSFRRERFEEDEGPTFQLDWAGDGCWNVSEEDEEIVVDLDQFPVQKEARPKRKYTRAPDKCMHKGCKAPPDWEYIWADHRARCWFCDKHGLEWETKIRRVDPTDIDLKMRTIGGRVDPKHACHFPNNKEMQDFVRRYREEGGFSAQRAAEEAYRKFWAKHAGDLPDDLMGTLHAQRLSPAINKRLQDIEEMWSRTPEYAAALHEDLRYKEAYHIYRKTQRMKNIEAFKKKYLRSAGRGGR